jgi:Stigma-specific protein, Stig1
VHRVCFLSALLVAGCGDQGTACKSVMMDPLLGGAGLVRVDVYDGANAHCDGAALEPGAGQPQLSQSFTAGQPVRLSISPGAHTVVVTTYADAAGTAVTGVACDETSFAGGKRACLSVSLEAVDAGAAICHTSPDDCPAGQYCAGQSCASGCKDDSDCSPQKCDPTRHQCVDCVTQNDCPSGQVCSTSGRCAMGCNGSGDCGSDSCCSMVCVDEKSDPGNCGGCGNACTGGDTLCCNSECANPSTSTTHCGMCGNACSTLNATPVCNAGTCDWTCNAGFAHCGSGNTGCDTDVTTVNDCGGCGNVCGSANATSNQCTAGKCAYQCKAGFLDCLQVSGNTDGCETAEDIGHCGGCNAACDTTQSIGADCPSGSCTYSGCVSGYSDCDKSGANANGCECATPMCCGTKCQPIHMNGLGQSYLSSCDALGTYNVTTANEAANAWNATATTGSSSCGNSSCVWRLSATECAVWCYSKMHLGQVIKVTASSCISPTNVCPSGSSGTWN